MKKLVCRLIPVLDAPLKEAHRKITPWRSIPRADPLGISQPLRFAPKVRYEILQLCYSVYATIAYTAFNLGYWLITPGVPHTVPKRIRYLATLVDRLSTVCTYKRVQLLGFQTYRVLQIGWTIKICLTSIRSAPSVRRTIYTCAARRKHRRLSCSL